MMLLPLDPLFSFIIGRRCVMDIKGYCTFIHLVGRLLMRKVMTDEAGNLWGYNIRGTRESNEQVYFFKDAVYKLIKRPNCNQVAYKIFKIKIKILKKKMFWSNYLYCATCNNKVHVDN